MVCIKVTMAKNFKLIEEDVVIWGGSSGDEQPELERSGVDGAR